RRATHLHLPTLRPPPTSPTLFPYTTLFRSLAQRAVDLARAKHHANGRDIFPVVAAPQLGRRRRHHIFTCLVAAVIAFHRLVRAQDRKSTRLNSSHEWTSYAVFCLKTQDPPA